MANEKPIDSDVDMDDAYGRLSRQKRKERVNALTNDFVAKARAILESEVEPDADDRVERVVDMLRDEVVPQLEKWGEL